jgi:hypothetical protein
MSLRLIQHHTMKICQETEVKFHEFISKTLNVKTLVSVMSQ